MTSSFSKRGNRCRQRVTHIHYYCDLTEAKAFGELMGTTSCLAQADRVRELVFVCDGAAWIWNLITTHYSQAVQIIDCVMPPIVYTA